MHSTFVRAFLAGDPAPGALDKLRTKGEELHLRARELYVYYTNGMGRSRLTPAALERALQTRGTCRNWNTVNTLVKL